MFNAGMLVLFLFSLPVFGSEFKYIKLNPDFEGYLHKVNQTTPVHRNMARNIIGNTAVDDQLEGLMRQALLGASPRTATTRAGMMGPSSAAYANVEPPLYEEIRDHLQEAHQQIGRDEIARIFRLNNDFNLGTANFSGFSWQKPFGTVQVYADRQVMPNFETEGPHDAWLVQDTFTFNIEATTYLESLRRARLVIMSETEIGAFAGVTFKRVYTYYHYAPSYQDGLTADLSKLFLPYTRFNKSGLEKLSNKEIIKREDKFTASTGGLISTPPIYHLSFSAGILAEMDMELMTSVQAFHDQDPRAHRFTLGARRKAGKKVGVALDLQLEFFKLLKLTLIRTEMNYEYTQGREFTLGFNGQQWNDVFSHEAQNKELQSILQGFTEIKDLVPYVIRLDETESSSIEAYGNILLWGRMDKSKHETNRIIKDNEVHYFHKTYMQSTRFVESLLSKIFTEFLYQILKLPVGSKDKAIYDRRLTMEYKATHPQSENSNIQRVLGAEDFSFKLSRSFETATSKYKNDAAWFVKEFTSLPTVYQSDIKNNRIRPPMRVDSHLRVEQAGFRHFMGRTPKEIFGDLVRICKSSNLKKWQDEKERAKMLKKKHSKSSDNCVKTIGNKYLEFLDDYGVNDRMPSLAKFRSFMMEYVKACETITDMTGLFGQENVFLNGEINGVLTNGANFRDVFYHGQYRGDGVIDNFKRAYGARTPASITSE